MSREDPQLKLRLAPDLKDRVQESARANNRTMNSEIVARLESTFPKNQDVKANFFMDAKVEELIKRKVQAVVGVVRPDMSGKINLVFSDPPYAEEKKSLTKPKP